MSDVNYTDRLAYGLQKLAESEEVWVEAYGLGGCYEVSNMGQVRSVDHYADTGKRRRKIRGRVLKPGRLYTGVVPYLVVNPSVLGAVRRSITLVHRLVLESFVGCCPSGQQCRHLDGNASNNRLDNLCWGTPAEDHQDKVRNGKTGVIGEENHAAILTEDDVREIRRKHLPRNATNGRGNSAELAKKFGVSQMAIWKVAKRMTWKHVE